MKIPVVTIESSDAFTRLCELGAACGADKSPYNRVGHRHPYTAVYSLLFGRFRYQPCRFAEIGIAMGASMVLWRCFFQHPSTTIFGFDRDENFLEHTNQLQMPDVHTLIMDVTDEGSIHAGFQQIGGNLDVILDDSTHNLSEQVKIIKAGLPYIKPGGMIVIEDVFRRIPNEDYEKALEGIADEFSFITFIMTEHKDKFSPDWDNDKLLVLIKK